MSTRPAPPVAMPERRTCCPAGSVRVAPSVTFARVVDVRYDGCLAALTDAAPAWRTGLELACGRRRRVEMELACSPWSTRQTLLELLPRGRCRPSGGYYRAGHALLDELTAAVRASADTAAVTLAG